MANQTRVVSVVPGATIREAALAMSEADVGSVLVMENDQLVGVFTERDLLKRVLAENEDVDMLPVSEAMTKDVITGNPDADVGTATRLMRNHHIRHLPVVAEDGAILGVLSIRDLIRDDMKELKDYIAQREG